MVPTSVSLLHRLRDREPRAWDEFVTVYRPFLAAQMRRFRLQAADVDDILQIVFATLLDALPKFDYQRDGSFRAWLRVFVANRARGFLRRGRRTITGSSDVDEQLAQLEDSSADISREWDRQHDRHVCEALLDRVDSFDESKKSMFRRYALDGMSPAEVASEFNVEVGVVYVTKARIHRRLRELAAGLIGPEESP